MRRLKAQEEAAKTLKAKDQETAKVIPPAPYFRWFRSHAAWLLSTGLISRCVFARWSKTPTHHRWLLCPLLESFVLEADLCSTFQTLREEDSTARAAVR